MRTLLINQSIIQSINQSINRSFDQSINQCYFSCRKRKELDSTQIKNHNSEVPAVAETISTMINPFDTDLEDLVNITSGEVATDVIKDLSAKIIGEKKLDEFVKQKMHQRNRTFFQVSQPQN